MEVRAHQTQDLDDERVSNGIEHLIARLAIQNKLLGAQNPKVLRHVRLFHAELLDQRTSRELSLSQQLQNRNASRMRERLKDIGFEATERIAHNRIVSYSNIHIHAFIIHFLGPKLRPGDVLVMDNLSVHKLEGVRQRVEAVGARLLYLPPYSPDLNPIEKEGSKLKTLLRSEKARTPEALHNAIERRLPGITAQDAQAWFRLPLAVQR